LQNNFTETSGFLTPLKTLELSALTTVVAPTTKARSMEQPIERGKKLSYSS
jgi:hypothetical protein